MSDRYITDGAMIIRADPKKGRIEVKAYKCCGPNIYNPIPFSSRTIRKSRDHFIHDLNDVLHWLDQLGVSANQKESMRRYLYTFSRSRPLSPLAEPRYFGPFLLQGGACRPR